MLEMGKFSFGGTLWMELKEKVTRPVETESCQQVPLEAALVFTFIGELAWTEPTFPPSLKNPKFFPLGESAFRQQCDTNHFYLEKNKTSMFSLSLKRLCSLNHVSLSQQETLFPAEGNLQAIGKILQRKF